MKKTIIIAVLGAAGFAASSYGQGAISFDTYAGVSGAFPVYFNGANAGQTIGSGFTAQLYYALGTVTDPVNNSDAASIMSSVGGAFTSIATSPVLPNGSVQDGNGVIISAYSSGPISFEILFTGTVGGVDYSGRTGAFTESSILTSGPLSYFGDNGPGVPASFVAAPVPEPTTLALAGLGGLASLVAFRRKQA
jgi:hypothetical protein